MMNRYKKIIISLAALLCIPCMSLGGFSPSRLLSKLQQNAAQEAQQAPKTTTEKQLATLIKEKEDITRHPEIRSLLEEISTAISTARQRIRVVPDQSAFLNKKLSLLGSLYQVLTELEQVVPQLEATIELHIKLLEEYAADQSFEGLRIPVRSSYAFDDLRQLVRSILDVQTRLADVEKNKKSAEDDVVKRKRALATIQEEFKEKERQQEGFSAETKDDFSGFTTRQRSELLDEQTRLLRYKKDLLSERVKEAEQRLSYVDSQIFVLRGQLVVLKEEYAHIKRALHVDTAYVRQAEKELEENRQDSVAKRDRINEKMRVLLPYRDSLKRRLDEAIKKLDLSTVDTTQFREWTRDPKSYSDWQGICEVSTRYAQISETEVSREYLEAQLELEKARFRHEEIRLDIIRSWHRMTSRSTRSEDFWEQEIKRYDTPRAELQAEIATLKDKRNANIDQLRHLNGYLERIKALAGQLREAEKNLFRHRENEHRDCLARIYEAEDHIRKRIDWTAKLIEAYSTTIAIATETLQETDDVISELQARSFWRRSTLSIEWTELQHVRPDIERFFKDVASNTADYFSLAKTKNMAKWAKKLTDHPGRLLLILIRLIILLIIFLLIRLYLPEFASYLSSGAFDSRLSSLRLTVAALFDFIRKHLVVFYAWMVFFLLMRFEFITHTFVGIWFYLLSIPYLLYLGYRFFRYLFWLNRQKNYLLISEYYEKRFFLVVPSFLYFLIVLLFLREAFLLGGYQASPVPAVLLALCFIGLQIVFMSLIVKDHVLNLLPNKSPLWEWIKEHVSKYYYVLWVALGAIIVMSNPYVGYGRQVLYVLSRLALTAIFIPVLFWIHNKLKRALSGLFFYYDTGEVLKERFSSSKTWYGIVVIASFLAFVFVGIVVGARIWGKVLGWYDFSDWLSYELYSPGIDEMGKRISITLFSLIKIGLFVVAGLVSYLVARFVLNQIFGFLLSGSGVQHAVMSLLRYLFIILGFLMGLNSVGLQGTVLTVLVALGGVAVLVREPLSDFFCYLIILIQRPVKIGDLVLIDQQIRGVVRHITPRAVVLRQNNSVTVVIPNSRIITQPVVNWNYSRTYFAFEDIMVTVPYSSDPASVRTLILKILDANLNVLKSPAPIVRLNDFTDNGYQFMVRGFLTADKVLEQWDIASEVRLEIVRVLRQQGIVIASPTRTLKVVASSKKIEELAEDIPDDIS